MNNICIILTSTIIVQNKDYLIQTNKNERLENYLKSIIKWIENTNFNIVLVDNSNYSYPELNEYLIKYKHRFQIIYFNESIIEEARYLLNDKSKGSSELFAIHYAYYNSDLIKNSIFVIKITGRYFIQELESFLGNYDLNDYDTLCQNDVDRCEMLGCHIKWFHIVFNKYPINQYLSYDFHIENIYKYRIHALSKNVLKCKIFNIEPTRRGGNNELFLNI